MGLILHYKLPYSIISVDFSWLYIPTSAVFSVLEINLPPVVESYRRRGRRTLSPGHCFIQ